MKTELRGGANSSGGGPRRRGAVPRPAPVGRGVEGPRVAGRRRGPGARWPTAGAGPGRLEGPRARRGRPPPRRPRLVALAGQVAARPPGSTRARRAGPAAGPTDEPRAERGERPARPAPRPEPRAPPRLGAEGPLLRRSALAVGVEDAGRGGADAKEGSFGSGVDGSPAGADLSAGGEAVEVREAAGALFKRPP